MTKFNAENERIKRQYLEWEKEARGRSESTVTNIREAICRFEEHTGFKSFKQTNKNDLISFKKTLGQRRNMRTGDAVSKTYLLHTLTHLISFFQWLCTQKGYKRKISATDISYLNLSAKDVQIARSPRSKRYPTLEQIEHVIRNMSSTTEVQKRNRALIAFLALTGCRVTALASLKLKHVFIEDERVEQQPQEVKTKFSKKIVTYFFPVGDIFKDVVRDWINFLINEKHCDYDSPLFPSTKLSLNENDQFVREALDTIPWQSTTSIRTIIKQAFENAGFTYYKPHSFRDTIVRHTLKICKTAEEFKAVSQNIGHNSPLTTFTSYGIIDEFNQGEIIKGLAKKDTNVTSFTNQELCEIKRLLTKTNKHDINIYLPG